jgi:hypothetical protein
MKVFSHPSEWYKPSNYGAWELTKILSKIYSQVVHNLKLVPCTVNEQCGGRARKSGLCFVPVSNPPTMATTRVTARAASWKPACWRAVLLSPGSRNISTSLTSFRALEFPCGALAGNCRYKLQQNEQLAYSHWE